MESEKCAEAEESINNPKKPSTKNNVTKTKSSLEKSKFLIKLKLFIV